MLSKKWAQSHYMSYCGVDFNNLQIFLEVIMMNGWMGSILKANLSDGKTVKEDLEEDLARHYVGGRGVNARILYDETNPGIDPLGPENKLIVGAGPCNGTGVIANSRLTLSAKSPVTGFLGSSNSGGVFGVEMKYAGYDAIIIEGKSENPVYLWIDNDNVELRDAKKLWGKTTFEARKIIQREVGHPDIGVLGIGPAGENLVRFASVTSDWGRSNGKTGMGAVMGSKKLKAIAVRGTQGVKVARSDLIEKANGELLRHWRDNEMVLGQPHITMAKVAKIYKNYGSTFYLTVENDVIGSLPIKNYQEGTWGEKAHPLYPEPLKEKYYLKPRSCFSCFVPDDRGYVITEGPFAGTWGTGLYNMQQYSLGTMMGINDADAMVRATALCDMYGMDVSMIGVIIAWAMECYEKGILREKDTDGLKLEWGNSEAALRLIEMIAYRKGIGNLFSEGIKKASETVGQGSEKFAMHVKGLAVDFPDLRAHKSYALGAAVASRGADHCMHFSQAEMGFGGWDPDPIRGEIWDGEKVDGTAEKDKGKMVKWLEDVRAFQNCMQVCVFVYFLPFASQPEMCAKYYNAVTGLDLTARDVLHIGERIVNLEKAYNIREGWTRKDDNLPDRFLKETLPAGPAKGKMVDLEPMLNEYYSERKWDQSGLPTREKLTALGLDTVADDLENMWKLGSNN
jgi:aldehyde:ferredoxin oxidoreductase